MLTLKESTRTKFETGSGLDRHGERVGEKRRAGPALKTARIDYLKERLIYVAPLFRS